jgi:tetratricopeptide (TPR) repeat protein
VNESEELKKKTELIEKLREDLKLDETGVAVKIQENIEKIREIKSKRALALNNKGVAHYYLQKFEEAARAYREAIKVHPDDSLAHNNLAYLYLSHGDYESASEELEKSGPVGEEEGYSLIMRGRIEIEKERYNPAIKAFEHSIRTNLDDLSPFLWEAYARYLLAETSFGPKDRAYKAEMFSIIRELERARHLSDAKKEREVRECIHYFLGYFYYKNSDIFTAKERLEQCIYLESRRVKFWEFLSSKSKWEKLCRFKQSSSKSSKLWKFFAREWVLRSKSPTEQRARELLDHIWKNKINPPWYSWWLSSPLHCWPKRAAFLLLLLPICLPLLYSFLPIPMMLVRGDTFIYVQILPEPVSFIKEHLSVYVLFITVSLTFLLLPRAEKITAKDFQIEIRSPPSFDPFLSPSMIEQKIGELEMI